MNDSYKKDCSENFLQNLKLKSQQQIWDISLGGNSREAKIHKKNFDLILTFK